MNIQVQGRHFVVSDVLRQHAELLLQRLGRQFPAIRYSHVTLTPGRQEHQVDIRVWAEGLDLSSQAHGEDMYTTLSRAVGKLERRLQRGSDRGYRFGNHHGQHATFRSPDQRPPALLQDEM